MSQKAKVEQSLFQTEQAQIEALTKELPPRGSFSHPHEKSRCSGATSIDAFGRPVRYFRQMRYEELDALLKNGEVRGDSKPGAKEEFERQKENLRQILTEKFNRLSPQISQQLASDFQSLMDNFTYNNYLTFLHTRLPRLALFELHATDTNALEGLVSLSVGAPILPPTNPRPNDPRYSAGIPIIEFVIPPDEVIIHPLTTNSPLREKEKEANTTTLKSDWITDIYQGENDFMARFVTAPDSPLFKYWGKEVTSEGFSRHAYDAFDTLSDWKVSESLEDYIPADKIDELDPNNPALRAPLNEKEIAQ